jgi:lipoprotein-releasing system ATP-binding protein
MGQDNFCYRGHSQPDESRRLSNNCPLGDTCLFARCVGTKLAGGKIKAGGDFAGESIMSRDNFLLEAEGVYKSYRMGTAEVSVLKGVDLAVKRGEFVAIVGASGSGKSTLLHILGTLDKQDKGVVRFEGQDLSRFGAGKLNRFRNKMVGFVFQFYHLLDELNVLENVFLPAMAGKSVVGWLASQRWAKTRARELLAELGLSERANHKPYQLSGGERQRVAIGRALMNEPRLLLADEPTGNLDSATGNGILKVFAKLNRAGQTIVMVTHDERIAQKAGRIITLADGKIM